MMKCRKTRVRAHPSVVRRNSGECTNLARCNPHLARKRPDRNPDISLLPSIKPPRNTLPTIDLPQLQRRLLKLIRKQSKSRDKPRPPPVRRFDAEDVDLEGVAWGGAGNVHGAVDLVELREYERGDRRGGGGRRDLAVAGVETVERDGVSRVYGEHRWDAGELVVV